MATGPKKSVSVLLPMDIYLKLQPLAKESCRSLSGYIRETLRQHVRRQSDSQSNPSGQNAINTKEGPGC